MSRADELAAIAQAVEAGRVKVCPKVPSVEQPREFQSRGVRVVVPYFDVHGNARIGEGYQTPKARAR